MTDREAALVRVGVQVQSPSNVGWGAKIDGDAVSAFSGYGEYTPITVRADTVISNADMERDQRRD